MTESHTLTKSASFSQKTGRWWLAGWESRFVAHWVTRIPAWLGTHHLTSATILWSALAIACGWLAAQGDLRWLCGVSLAIALQYLSDLFDGAVGRHRETGLVRWGFYMDHLLDFVFLCSLFVAWSLVLPASAQPWFFGLLGVAGASMVSSFLAFSATGEFRISHLGVGPTELRLAAIVATQALAFFGPAPFARALPLALGISLVLLAGLIGANHRRLWALDMQIRARPAEAGADHGGDACAGWQPDGYSGP